MAEGQGGIRAGAAYVELYAKDGRLTRGLAAASRRLMAFGASVTAFSARWGSLAALRLGAFAFAGKIAADMGSELLELSQRTGLSVESLSELKYAAEQSGSSVEALEIGVKRTQKTIAEAAKGNKEAAESLQGVGLSIESFSGLDSEKQFLKVAKAVADIPNPTLRAAAAIKIWGRSGTDLLPMLSDGAAGLDALRKRAQELGLVMSTEDAEALDLMGDLFTDLVKTIKMVAVSVGAALAPVLTDLAKTLAKVAADTITWIKANRAIVVATAKGIATYAATYLAIAAVGLAITGAGYALSVLAKTLHITVAAVTLLRHVLLPFQLILTGLRIATVGLRAAFALCATALMVMRTVAMLATISMVIYRAAIVLATVAIDIFRRLMVSTSVAGGVLRAATLALSSAYHLLVFAMRAGALWGAICRATWSALAVGTQALRVALLAGAAAFQLTKSLALATASAYATFKAVVAASIATTVAFKNVLLATKAAFTSLRASVVAFFGALNAIKTTAMVFSGVFSFIATLSSVVAAVSIPLTLMVGALAGVAYFAFRAAGGLAGIIAMAGQLKGSVFAAGRSIWDNLINAFGVLKEIGVKAFSGILDALIIGEWALAGRIAMSALKLVMLQGVQAISQAVGGAFGQFLGTVVQQLAGGDFAGAWTTVIKSLAAVWDQFLNGMIGAFSAAAKTLAKMWVGVQKQISDFILDNAAKGGMFGKLALLGTGVDVSTEQGRAEADRLKEISVKERLLAQARKDLEAARAGGGSMRSASGIEQTTEGITSVIADLENRLTALGATQVDVLADMQAAANEQLDGTVTRLDNALGAIKEQAAENAAKAADELGKQGVLGIDDQAIKDAQREFNNLLVLLTKQQEEYGRKERKRQDDLATSMLAVSSTIAGTFNANVAGRFANGGVNWQQRTAGNTARSVEEQKKSNNWLDKIAKATGLQPVGNK